MLYLQTIGKYDILGIGEMAKRGGYIAPHRVRVTINFDLLNMTNESVLHQVADNLCC